MTSAAREQSPSAGMSSLFGRKVSKFPHVETVLLTITSSGNRAKDGEGRR
jgi:hypothetical protein